MKIDEVKNLGTYYQQDIFPEMEIAEVNFTDRLTGKCIIVNSQNMIALVTNTVHYIYTLPGGGIDDGESLEDGIIREIREETGYDIDITHMLGVIDDYRDRDARHTITYCAVAKVRGDKKDQILTDEERENGLHIKWFTLGEALRTFEEENELVKLGQIKYYNTAYNIFRDYRFLREYFESNIKPIA